MTHTEHTKHAEHNDRIEQLESRLRDTNCILNDLLMLWITQNGKDWNTVRDAFDALAANRGVLENLPVTASFADEVEGRTKS